MVETYCLGYNGIVIMANDGMRGSQVSILLQFL